MNPASSELREEIAEAANVLARLGLVTAYGHVSARAGTSMLITPAADLALVTRASVLEVPLGVAVAGALPAGVPAEAWAHLALYQARPDAAAIARAQPASAFAAAATASSLVPLHGQAAWLGESIPVHDQCDAAPLPRSRAKRGPQPASWRGSAAARQRRPHPGRDTGSRGRADVAARRHLRGLPRGGRGQRA